MLEYDWPGNLRELANYASQVAVGVTLFAADSISNQGLVPRVQAYEAELIREALTRHQGDIRRVLADLRIPRKTLYDKMARHGVVPAAHRNP